MLWYLDDHQDAIRLITTFTVLLPLAGAVGITPVGMCSTNDSPIPVSHVLIRSPSG